MYTVLHMNISIKVPGDRAKSPFNFCLSRYLEYNQECIDVVFSLLVSDRYTKVLLFSSILQDSHLFQLKVLH